METLVRHFSGTVRHSQEAHFSLEEEIHTGNDRAHPLTGTAKNGDTEIALTGNPSHPAGTLDGLLASIEKEGLRFLDKLKGAFVGYVRLGNRHYLFRDRSGLRTLYFFNHQGITHFSADNSSLRSLPEYTPRIRAASVAQYLSFSYVPLQHTMLEGIYELPAGSYWEMGAEHPTRYFFPESQVVPTNISDEEWVQEFHDLYARALIKRERSEMPKATFLSGGLDSSFVTATLAQRYGAENVHAFAIHFGKDYPNELPFAQTVASHLGIHYEEFEVNPKQFVSLLPEIVQRLNDPIGDPVAMPNYQLAAHVAQQGFRSVYNGEGGDPLFGGPKNMTMLLHHWYGEKLDQPNHRERAYLASYRRGYEELKRLLTPDMLTQIDEEQHLESILTPFFAQEEPHSFLKKLLLINMRLKGAHLILPKVERMLGAHGMTPLSPLFDEELISLVMRLPNHLILKHGIEKQILKHAARGALPNQIIDRPKSGMRVPVHYWFKGEMQRYARHILLSKKTKNAGIFCPKRLKKLLRYDTEEGKGRYGIRIWMLLTFELWRREVFNEND